MVKRPSVNISHKSLRLPQLSTNFGSVYLIDDSDLVILRPCTHYKFTYYYY